MELRTKPGTAINPSCCFIAPSLSSGHIPFVLAAEDNQSLFPVMKGADYFANIQRCARRLGEHSMPTSETEIEIVRIPSRNLGLIGPICVSDSLGASQPLF
jgi:hypothetical protein